MRAEAAKWLTELGGILDQVDELHYTTKIDLLSSATIGQHVRHIIEFYQCLIGSLDSGVVNYCHRKRDHSIETLCSKAKKTLDGVVDQLNQLTENCDLQLQTDESGSAVIASNLDRELLYCLEHAIHHMAMIKVGLQLISPETKIPPTFGVAASTVKHRERSFS